MLDASHIVPLHDQATAHWHDPSSPCPAPLTLRRSSSSTSTAPTSTSGTTKTRPATPTPPTHHRRVKHAIDRLNQLRNDLAEQIDLLLLADVPRNDPSAPLHSETPGLIIDRLSILALKIFHTEEEAHRSDAPEHRQRNQDPPRRARTPSAPTSPAASTRSGPTSSPAAAASSSIANSRCITTPHLTLSYTDTHSAEQLTIYRVHTV